MAGYKRTAKPRNTPPTTAAMLRAALGTKPDGAAPTWGVLEPVACCPPKPVTGMLLVAEAPPVCEAVAMEEEREALPKKGVWAPQGWSELKYKCQPRFVSSHTVQG